LRKRLTTGPIEYAEARGCRQPLLAYDGSAGADRALELAVEVASSSHGRLTIITAAAQVPFIAYTGASPEAVNELRRVTLEEGQRALCRAVDRIPQGIPVTKMLSRKPIQEALLQQARAGDHDLMILGSGRRGTIRAALLGSLGRDMLRLSPLPVLIAGAEAEEADGRTERLTGAQVVPMTPKRA
jgi:nucleotide-binding universal stress UspA family protein